MISVNGIQEEFDGTLEDYLKLKGPKHPYFAIAINNEFVSKEEYNQKKLQPNDCIEIVTPHPGG